MNFAWDTPRKLRWLWGGLILLLVVAGGVVWQRMARSDAAREDAGVAEPEVRPRKLKAKATSRGGLRIVQARVDRGRRVRLRLRLPAPRPAEEFVLARSTSSLQETRLNYVRYPLTLIRLAPGTSAYRQKEVGWGVRYEYQLLRVSLSGKVRGKSKRVQVTVPNKPIAHARLSRKRVWLHVDKFHYVLSLYEGSRLWKRYPIALGRDPYRRKLHSDNATTPEGYYRIRYRWPKATYYKALGISYPNRVDRRRYRRWVRKQRRLGRSIEPIGGAIQIHGLGIQNNWTFGCMALRNKDIDELFTIRAIRRGVRVRIIGLSTHRFPVPRFLRRQLGPLER